MVLAQAIPSDSVAYALASSSAFAAEMASSLSAGNTPTWYQALPTDVQSLLPQIYPAAVQVTPTPTPTPTPSSSAYVVKSSSVVEVIIAGKPRRSRVADEIRQMGMWIVEMSYATAS